MGRCRKHQLVVLLSLLLGACFLAETPPDAANGDDDDVPIPGDDDDDGETPSPEAVSDDGSLVLASMAEGAPLGFEPPGAQGGFFQAPCFAVEQDGSDTTDLDDDCFPVDATYDYSNCTNSSENHSTTYSASRKYVDGDESADGFEYASPAVSLDQVTSESISTFGPGESESFATSGAWTGRQDPGEDPQLNEVNTLESFERSEMGATTVSASGSYDWDVTYHPTGTWTKCAAVDQGTLEIAGVASSLVVNGHTRTHVTIVTTEPLVLNKTTCASNYVVDGTLRATYQTNGGTATMWVRWNGCGDREGLREDPPAD